jgi:hypothetical protein
MARGSVKKDYDRSGEAVQHEKRLVKLRDYILKDRE